MELLALTHLRRDTGLHVSVFYTCTVANRLEPRSWLQTVSSSNTLFWKILSKIKKIFKFKLVQTDFWLRIFCIPDWNGLKQVICLTCCSELPLGEVNVFTFHWQNCVVTNKLMIPYAYVVKNQRVEVNNNRSTWIDVPIHSNIKTRVDINTVGG